MRLLQTLGGVVAVIASILVARIVLHAYTEHGHLDVFHLVVASASALLGLAVLYRALVILRPGPTK